MERPCTPATPWEAHWHACADDVMMTIGPLVDMRHVDAHPSLGLLRGMIADFHQCHTLAMMWMFADTLAHEGFDSKEIRAIVIEDATGRLLA